MPHTLPSPDSSDLLRAERFESSLHLRIIGRAGQPDRENWRLISLEYGKAEITDGQETFELTAPCVVWQPWTRDMRLRIQAGAVGSHLLLEQGLLTAAIGHKPEATELRFMCERRAHLPLQNNPDLARTFTQSMTMIIGELQTGAAAERTIVEATLRIILVHLWRAQGAPETRERSSSTARYLGQFNNLVEVHFRERWPVSRYASSLGITVDRLNDICQRGRDRTPRQIIAARTGVEARLLLENSMLSLGEIANQLGFPGTAQFNRFFKSIFGVPPGQYRRQYLAPGQQPPASEASQLYDWP